MKKALTIYIDGKYEDISGDDFKMLSPGFLNGLGIFDTILCEKKNIYFLEEHYRRFIYGCDRYILPRPPGVGEIKKIIAHLMKTNGFHNARVRFVAWRKSYDTHFAIVFIPCEAFPASSYREGFAACVYSKFLDRSPELVKIKSLDYKFFLDAYEFALKNHCHEAILLSSSGMIVEGSRSNIFIVKKKKLLTPSLSCGCLAGVTRQMVLTAAKRVGVRTSAVELPLNDLQHCDEAFLTNSLIGIMPLTYLGDHKISSGRPGPITAHVMQGYKKLRQAGAEFLV